jgi:iron complex outermembrane receptor protein
LESKWSVYINDKYTLRSSLSTGFRAPTLHQIYTQKHNIVLFLDKNSSWWFGKQRIFSSRFIRYPKLKEETSTNFTFGIGGKVGILVLH